MTLGVKGCRPLTQTKRPRYTESSWKPVDFTKANASRAGVGSIPVGNCAAIDPSCIGPVAGQDVQHADGISGFHIVLVGSPDRLSVLGP